MLDCQGKYNSDHNRPGMVEGCSQKQNILMKLSKFQKKKIVAWSFFVFLMCSVSMKMKNKINLKVQCTNIFPISVFMPCTHLNLWRGWSFTCTVFSVKFRILAAPFVCTPHFFLLCCAFQSPYFHQECYVLFCFSRVDPSLWGKW